MRSTRIFRNGHSMAVRLPKEFAVVGGEVFIAREGQAIIIRPFPAEPAGLIPFLQRLSGHMKRTRPHDPVPFDPADLP